MENVSPFLIGLVSVGWCASGMLVWVTLHHYLARQPERIEVAVDGEVPSHVEALRKAA